jgi:NAD(P) transhydrogenase subunit alpha
LEVDLGGLKTEDAGGYAVELSEEAMNRGRALIAEHAKTTDVLITTAQVPGRRAPLLITEEAVNGMKRGSVVIDLAGATGGNCALSKADEVVERKWCDDPRADKLARISCSSCEPALFEEHQFLLVAVD